MAHHTGLMNPTPPQDTEIHKAPGSALPLSSDFLFLLSCNLARQRFKSIILFSSSPCLISRRFLSAGIAKNSKSGFRHSAHAAHSASARLINMAEALGVAASVIAVVDITAKVGGATFKLMKLWNEVKEVPTMLLEKAERVKDLEDFLLDAEDHIQNSRLPQAFWNNTNHRLQQHIEKVRRALDEIQDMVDKLQASITARKDGFRSKLLSTKVVFRKEELKALDRKLDAALRLFAFAQRQWLMAMLASKTSLSIIERSESSNTPTLERKTKRVLASTTPALFYISTPASVLPTFRFDFGDNGNFQFSFQAPSWLTGCVYSMIAQKSYQGWLLNLRAYEVVNYFDDEILYGIENDDPSRTLQVLSEKGMTPFAKNKYGQSLLHIAVECRSPRVTEAFLERGLACFVRDPPNNFRSNSTKVVSG
ncbi:hypothetical protein BDP55DRAFT_254409 [Colletotrichum godetiae]|uniref:Ankyrin repeat protein n=1 Tax=Colletotrichum godetiae TaxID=1209918 RepID=A0AAJ0ESI0_9PEZI|nr:uncharacterized protein BDP55DRAFT_254409 [Colletotrichum godetiae]KAK1672323.1 hypothetical protein BDP55DRAFT_254409 [Colletotrichum godetiae]